jgi:4-amino-4-deoxy-L-arabinose transferase-like glycosyltransferase
LGGKSWLKPHHLLLAGALLMLYFGGLGAIPYFEPDEGRYTEIPREMLALKDFVLPRLNGVLYFEKPPLYYWLNALSQAVFGISEFSSRFWSAMLGMLGLIPTFYLGTKARNRPAGVLAAIILGTSPLYLALAHLTIIDMTLTFFFTVTLSCFYLASEEKSPPKVPWLWYGMFAAAACTVLAKGLIGMALPEPSYSRMLLGTRWQVLKRVPWLSGTALFLAIAAPWHVLAALRNPDFLQFYFVREHFLRYLTTLHARTEPWWFFIPVVIWALLPWIALLPSSLGDLGGRSEHGRRRFISASPELFLWLWAGIVIVFFSLSHSKLIPYVLPALPPLAILAALKAEDLIRGREVAGAWVKALLLVALLGVAFFGGTFVWAGLGRVRAFGRAGEVSLSVLLTGTVCVALALLAARFVLGGRWRNAFLAMMLCTAASFACIWSAALIIPRNRDARAFAAFIQAHEKPGDRVFSYGTYLQALPVYLRRPIGVAAFEGELGFGISKLSEEERNERFPTALAFARLWNSPTRVWCVVDRDDLKKINAGKFGPGKLGLDALAPPKVLLEEKQILLVTNRPIDAADGAP